MRLLDRLKRLLRGPRSFDSVALELAEGLRNGTIYLDHLPQEEVELPADRPAGADAVPAVASDGGPAGGANGAAAPAPDRPASDVRFP